MPSLRPNRQRECYVYAISDGEFLKVGNSYKPMARAREMQIGNPRELHVVWQEKYETKFDAEEKEKYLHNALSKFHHMKEWYRHEALFEIALHEGFIEYTESQRRTRSVVMSLAEGFAQ